MWIVLEEEVELCRAVVLVINLAAKVTATASQPEGSITQKAGTSTGKTHPTMPS